jgi:DNA replication protein DnaC
VQELLAAKRDLELPRALRKLDQFAVLILDDVGYIQQSPECCRSRESAEIWTDED